MEIKIKYLHDSPIKLAPLEQGDWIDIPLPQDVNLLGNIEKKIPLGIAMQLPKDYEAHIDPRSSTFRKFGIIQTNSLGIIDNSYNGPEDEWFIPYLVVHNHPELRVIPRGTRVCQFRIIKKQPKIQFKESTLEHNTNRGGDGSTGL